MPFSTWWNSGDYEDEHVYEVAEQAYAAGMKEAELPKPGSIVRLLEDDRDWSVISNYKKEITVTINDIEKTIHVSLLQPKYIIFWCDFKLEGYRKDIVELYNLLKETGIDENDILIKSLKNGKEVKLREKLFLVEVD